MAASTAKYSSNGELFASVRLGKELSEDTSEGRLILMHCNTVYLSPFGMQHRRKVYEALIEDKGKNSIYLRLSAQTVLVSMSLKNIIMKMYCFIFILCQKHLYSIIFPKILNVSSLKLECLGRIKNYK